MELLGILLWGIAIIMAISLLYIKWIEFKLLFAGYRMSKIMTKMTNHKYALHHFCIVDNTDNQIVYIFKNFFEYRKYFKLFMREIHGDLFNLY